MRAHWRDGFEKALAALLGGFLLVSALVQVAAAAERSLSITAPAHVYAHIYRDFPVEDGDEIVLEARLRALPNAGASWTTSITLYWFPTAFVSLGHQPDGRWRAHSVGVPLGALGDVIAPGGTWVHARIHLTRDRVQLWMKPGEGEWTLLREADRPSAMAMAPFEIIVGKGFSSTREPYLEEHLDNSYAEPGDIGVAYVAGLTVTVDGEVVLAERFETLQGWGIHIDPAFEEQVRIETVEATP